MGKNGVEVKNQLIDFIRLSKSHFCQKWLKTQIGEGIDGWIRVMKPSGSRSGPPAWNRRTKLTSRSSSVRAKGFRLNRTAGKWNARFRGFAMIVATVGIMKHWPATARPWFRSAPFVCYWNDWSHNFKTASKLDFGHLGYEALSINTLSFDPVPEFFNIGWNNRRWKNVSH